MESFDNPLTSVLKETRGYISELELFFKDPAVSISDARRFLEAWNNLVESEILAPSGEVLGKKKDDEKPN